jgi:hypothetical protein
MKKTLVIVMAIAMLILPMTGTGAIAAGIHHHGGSNTYQVDAYSPDVCDRTWICDQISTSSQVTTAITAPSCCGYIWRSQYRAAAVRLTDWRRDRVRVYDFESGTDLRIDPNSTGNWVGDRYNKTARYVRCVQHLLVFQGYNLSVDGVWGPQTALAVHDFQMDWNLTPDSVVGTNTWYKLCGGGTAS